MKWRKINRILHRDLGYIFFGMTIIYAVSGIVLNHRKPGGDASIISRSETFSHMPVSREQFDADFIHELMAGREIDPSRLKNFYFPSEELAIIYIRDGHIRYNISNGDVELVTIKKRPVLSAFNFLHYNKPKKLWTWFSDIYAASLILIAITGLFILRGKQGITRRGAVLTLAGIIIPLIFLFFYL